jgi:tetratricopeptide (TPR) repeat protein
MWSAGDFDGCVVQLDEIGLARHSSDSILLRARALLRVHRIEEAEKWLRMVESRHSDEDAIATHAMLLGNACARLDKFERAAVLFDRARSVAMHPTVVAETAYYHALALWQARDYKTARSVLQPAVVAEQDNVSARALQLLGFIGVAEGKYAEAHTSFELALATLSRCQWKTCTARYRGTVSCATHT